MKYCKIKPNQIILFEIYFSLHINLEYYIKYISYKAGNYFVTYYASMHMYVCIICTHKMINLKLKVMNIIRIYARTICYKLITDLV